MRWYESSQVYKYYIGYIDSIVPLGSLAAKTAKLPRQKLTSHPSVKAELEQGEYNRYKLYPSLVKIPSCIDFEYIEAPVVVSGNLVTR